MPKIVIGIQGGSTNPGSPIHTDNLQGLEKLPQANGGVPAIITSHMTGNNKEGIEGGIDIKGIDKGEEKTDYHKR